jgi:hypothetical protein
MRTHDSKHNESPLEQINFRYDPACDIQEERNRQIEQWGNAFDDQHSQNDWVAFITAYAGKAYDTHAATKGQYPNPDVFRASMLKVGALSFAALEALQRYQECKEAEKDVANGA